MINVSGGDEMEKNIVNEIDPYKGIPGKYSLYTHEFFLHLLDERPKLFKNINVYWYPLNRMLGKSVSFENRNEIILPHVIFAGMNDRRMIGTSWESIVQADYRLRRYDVNEMKKLEVITDWFTEQYVKIGKCLYDPMHHDFMVDSKKRYSVIDENKRQCKYCGKIFEKRSNVGSKEVWFQIKETA